MKALIHVNEYYKFLKRFYNIDKPIEYYINRMCEYIEWCKLLDEQRRTETEVGRVASIMIAQYMHEQGWSTRDIEPFINNDKLPF